jgi:hypothetical protein
MLMRVHRSTGGHATLIIVETGDPLSTNAACSARRGKGHNQYKRFHGSAPEVVEPRRRQLGVAHRVLDVLVAKVCLQRPGVVAGICEGEAAGVPQHVGVGLDLQAGTPGSRRNDAREAMPCPIKPPPTMPVVDLRIISYSSCMSEAVSSGF